MMTTTPEPQVIENLPRRDAATLQRRWTAGIIAALLLVGAAGGYLLRWGTAHTRTVTTTRTEVLTVSAPPFASAKAESATVYFDGTHASYSGPTELARGTVLTIHFVPTVRSAAIAIAQLDDRTLSWDALMASNRRMHFSKHPDWVSVDGWVDGAGDLVVTLTPGLHEIVITGWQPPQDVILTPVVIRVTG